MKANKIPFNIPFMTSHLMHKALKLAMSFDMNEKTLLEMLEEVFRTHVPIGDDKAVFFTGSATQALEIMALSLNLKQGDEIIMPSYTYAATANAFARAGAVPVFADIDLSTMNLTVETVEPLITKRTKAIVPIHYGGISAELDALSKLSNAYDCLLLEDAAHGIGATYKGQALGSIGALGCLSFHHTKNITAAGSGGALILDKTSEWLRNVEEVLHQGTDRLSFLRGEASEYKWQRLGGEFAMPPFNSAFLCEAIKSLEIVTEKRRMLWKRYQEAFTSELGALVTERFLELPTENGDAELNGHIYYLILPNRQHREALKSKLNHLGIEAYTHYEPLHQSIAGVRHGAVRTAMTATDRAGEGLLRLPIYYDLTIDEQDYIIEMVVNHFKSEVM